MSVTVMLWNSADLGFDLDTVRPMPVYYDEVTEKSVVFDRYMDSKAHKTIRTANWNSVGDPLIVSGSFTEISRYNVGCIIHDGQRYYFRVRDVAVNESNRTQIVYDIDWEASYQIAYQKGYVTKCPLDSKFAVSTPIDPRRWVFESMASIGRSVCVVLALSQMKSSPSVSKADIDGPVFVILDGYWNRMQGGYLTATNIVSEFTTIGYCTNSDIVGAWVIPKLFQFGDGNLRYWKELSVASSTRGLRTAIYNTSPAWSVFDTNLTIIERKTDVNEGVMAVFTDERGNILYSVPDRMTTGTSLYCRFHLSMTSVEIDISLDGEGFFQSHTCNRMFTFSAKPMDTVVDAWKEYTARQREADIESRKIQNKQAMSGTAGNAASGALMGAAMGSVVPGVGTAVGAVAGAVTSLVGGAVNYGVSEHYGKKQQAVTDRVYQLAQDTLSVAGASVAWAIASGNVLNIVTIRADTQTINETKARNAIEGVDAQGFTETMTDDIAEAIVFENETDVTGKEFPWACMVEIPVIYGIPKTRKDAIRQTMAAGARWLPIRIR